MNGLSPQHRRRKRPAVAGEGAIAVGCLADESLPADIAACVRQAADRIYAWTPKGVHFGWETAFRNKGKFPASMSKTAARLLVRSLLLSAPLRVFANRREGRPADDEYRIVADAGQIVGTRGQRTLRIVLTRDAVGYVVDNAFPVIGA